MFNCKSAEKFHAKSCKFVLTLYTEQQVGSGSDILDYVVACMLNHVILMFYA